jgi:hypothetical protein
MVVSRATLSVVMTVGSFQFSRIVGKSQLIYHHHHHHHHHHISAMDLGHLLTRSGLTYPEVSSKVWHDSFCQSGRSVSLPWVIYYETFYLHVLSSFSCVPVVSPKLALFLTPLQFVYLFCSLYKCIMLFSRFFISYRRDCSLLQVCICSRMRTRGERSRHTEQRDCFTTRCS